MVDGSDLGDPLNCITEEATLEIYKSDILGDFYRENRRSA